MSHSFLPPSGAAAWSRCSLWPTMNAKFPQDETPESLEGTAAHWVGSEFLNKRYPSEGTAAPNGIIVTGEMLDGAELYAETVDKRSVFTGELHIEETVLVRDIHSDCFGTPDCWSYSHGNAHLEIVDYKYGHGFVDEYFNLQGLLYALGAIDSIPNLLVDLEKISVSFTIVQPRCFHKGEPVRTHSYTIEQAASYIGRLEAAASEAYEQNPTSTTNSECGHCPGRHACPTLQRAAYSDAEYAGSGQPHDISPAAAALELRMLERAYERLGARVEGLQELTLANIKRGARVPHYRAEPGKGRKQWSAPVAEIVALGRMFGKDLTKPGLLTPYQAEKLGIDESVIISYSQLIPGAVKLTPQNNDEASRVFGTTGE